MRARTIRVAKSSAISSDLHVPFGGGFCGLQDACGTGREIIDESDETFASLEHFRSVDHAFLEVRDLANHLLVHLVREFSPCNSVDWH